MKKEPEIIALRGNRKLWNQFVKKVKSNHETVWGVLKKWIEKYLEEK